MDPNRLHLNFGNNNERLVPSDRTYPTTPSTFPQPVFPNTMQQQQQQQLGARSAQPTQQYPGGYAPGNGYFAQGQYQPQYASMKSLITPLRLPDISPVRHTWNERSQCWPRSPALPPELGRRCEGEYLRYALSLARSDSSPDCWFCRAAT
ncbi:hypothetical protein RRF57_012817 [Xylaria bambusicola]|uniref:Uncharacterized protein n=1 Tax=Xylaria bambusicola TaxID=326684 RepID=A0AAN7UQL0_9PEZI